jgi:hypothetical protein
MPKYSKYQAPMMILTPVCAYATIASLNCVICLFLIVAIMKLVSVHTKYTPSDNKVELKNAG